MCGLVTSCAASSRKLNTYSHVCFYLLDVFTFHIFIYKTQRQIMCLCEKGGCVLQLLMLLRFQNYISMETSAKLINFHPPLTLSEVILELSSKWDGCMCVCSRYHVSARCLALTGPPHRYQTQILTHCSTNEQRGSVWVLRTSSGLIMPEKQGQCS